MLDSINILFLIGNLTFVIVLIIGFFVFRLSWNDAKKKKGTNTFQEQNTYAPYSCDEETDTFIALSTPTRFITILFFFYAIIVLIRSFHSFHQGGFILISIFALYCSLVFSMIPTKIVISPDFVTITYPILLFNRIIKIAKKDISYIGYKKKNTFLGYRVNISIIRINHSINLVLYLFNKNEQYIIDNSKIVLTRISKIFNVPIKPIRAA